MAGKVSPESRRELRKLNSALKVMAFLQGQDLTQASQVHPRPVLAIFSEALPWKGHLCIKSRKANIAMKTKLPHKREFVQNSKGFIIETGLLVLNALLSWHVL